MKKLILSAVLFAALFSCKDHNNPDAAPVANAIPAIDYELIQSHPHDTTAFTEGFLVHEGKLFESTGASENFPQTKSLFGEVNLQSGKIDTKAELDKTQYFGEGITFLNGKVYQLTYKTKIGFIYDAVSFKKIGDYTYPSVEGWGLTTDGKSLMMTDGTDVITYLDPTTFKTVKTINVTENGTSQRNLNELEYINGFIYANIWMTNTIVKIDPATGNIIGKLDLTSLATEAKNIYANSQEMNGIAFDPTSDKIYITGKLWPKIYEVKFSH